MRMATSWDDEGDRFARETVMGRLRARQRRHRQATERARDRVEEERSTLIHMMAPAPTAAKIADALAARSTGTWSVLAMLFAHPDSEAIRSLDARGAYFDVRTGDTWDLHFPGYARRLVEGDEPVGSRHLRSWSFDPRDFDALRVRIERNARGRWSYSGGTDLVLTSVWLPVAPEPPQIAWESTLSGCVTDAGTGTRTLSLPEVIERISRDLERALGDPDYGVGLVTRPDGTSADGSVRDVVTGALGGIFAALGANALGLQ